MKIFFRVLIGSLLGLFIWTCDLTNSGPDNLTITLPDSMKTSAGKYDSVRLDLVTVKGTDTTPRQVLFHGEYENPAQLRKMPLALSYKESYTVILKGYRKDALVLESHLKFEKGKAGKAVYILDIPAGSSGGSQGPGRPVVKGKTPVNTRTPTWTWTSGGGGNGNFRVSLDTPDMTGAMVLLEPTFTASKDLDTGTHTLYVQERDVAGNWSQSGQWGIRIDLTAPKSPKVASAQVLTNSPKPEWTWNPGGGGDLGLYRVKLNSTAFAPSDTTRETRFTPGGNLEDGTYTLNVQERDSAGNWSETGAFAVTVDRTPPGVPVFESAQLSPLATLRPTWTWKSGGGGVGIYRRKINDSLFTDKDTTTATSFSPGADLKEGLNTLYVQEKDAGGNWSPVGAQARVLVKRGPVGDPGFSELAALDISFAISPSGVPHVAYLFDNGSISNSFVMRYNGIKWERLGNYLDVMTSNSSLAISNNGTIFLAVNDGEKKDTGNVLRFNGSTWNPVTEVGFPSIGGGSADISLALDSKDILHVAIREPSHGDILILRQIGNKWEKLGATNVADCKTFINHFVLKINSQDIPFLAYSDIEGSKIYVKRLNSSTLAWDFVSTDGMPIKYYSLFSMDFGLNGMPYLGVENATSGEGTGSVYSLKANVWEPVGGLVFSADGPRNVSLAINHEGRPFVSFVEESGQRILGLIDSNWIDVGAREKNIGAGVLGFNKEGILYTAFQDTSKNEKVTVLKPAFDP